MEEIEKPLQDYICSTYNFPASPSSLLCVYLYDNTLYATDESCTLYILPKCQIFDLDDSYHCIYYLTGFLYLFGPTRMCTFDTSTNKIEHTELEIVRHIEKVRGWQDKMVLMEEEGIVRVVSKGGDVLREVSLFEEEGCDIYDIGLYNDFAYFATNKGIYRCDLAD